MIGTTVTQFLIGEQRRIHGATGDLTSVINDIVTACKAIASAMRYGALSEIDVHGVSGTRNPHGETQKSLDVIANALFMERTEIGGHVAAMVSEEMESVHELPDRSPRGSYLLLYDPVDGSSNIGDNATIGTIFSILRRPEGAVGSPGIAEFLQPGVRQVCAGYAVYGPSCMLVLTTGNGVNGFTLDPVVGEFILSHPSIGIPADCDRVFINAALAPCWDEGIRRYASDCAGGESGPRGRRFDLRWSGCAVADVHRVLMTGGIFISIADGATDDPGGKLRLLYEVNPLAWLVEQAGGRALGAPGRPLEIVPDTLHQRCEVAMGSRNEVDRLHSEYR